MSYSDFTLARVQADFGLTVDTTRDLFAGVPPVPVSPVLQQTLERQAPLALMGNTEKARSEWLIAPLLGELWVRSGRRISVLSGVEFEVDPAVGLTGVCDFLIGRTPQLFYVTAPVLVVVEAKKESIVGGFGQCAAAMVAARRFNQSEQSGVETVYGCVTSGNNWKFLRLDGTVLAIDLPEYQISQADRILGILMHAVGLPPESSAAA
jgi:hypothetical protein